MTPSEQAAWRERAATMSALLRADLADRDWNDAMRVMGHIGAAAGMPVLTAIAKRASGTTADAAEGLAVRRLACRQFTEALRRAEAA